jgi:uncharacterized membrane protein
LFIIELKINARSWYYLRISEIKSEALRIKEGNNWSFVGYSLIVIILTMMIPSAIEEFLFDDTSWVKEYDFITTISSLFITSVIYLGENKLYLNLVQEKDYSKKTLFSYFSNIPQYFKVVFFYFLTGLYIFFWTLLLIVPGIIKGLSYSMAPYIMIENPELSPNEAITISRKMMKGYKWKLFCLYLSFIGWFLLCILTLGIGLLWLNPYVQTSVALFYQHIKEEN